MYYHGINLYVNIASIILCIAAGLLFFRKNEEDVEYFKRLKMALGIYVFLFAICRIFYILAVWLPDYYDTCVKISYVSMSSGWFPIIFVSEHYLIKKTRHVFSIIALGLIAFMILGLFGLYDRHVLQFLLETLSAILGGFIAIIYVYLAITSIGVMRKDAELMIISIAVFAMGSYFDSEQIIIMEYASFSTNVIMVEFLYSVPPFCFIIGLAIFSSLQRITATAIDFYTNKRVCIVHKGVIKGKMFICSKCNAYYCLPCKEAIEQIDKCCWNCKTPFDQSAVDDAATISEVDPSKDISTPEIVDDGKKEKLGIEPGKGPAKGVVAGQESNKAPRKKSGVE